METSHLIAGLALVVFFWFLYRKFRKAKKDQPTTGGFPYTPPKNPKEVEK
jgi:hypothetical protein